MPQIDFADVFAEENAAGILHPIEPVRDLPLPAESPVVIEPSRFKRSEWANLVFAGITIAGGLFCAFYFFNGADLVRTTLAWPGELLYPQPVETSSHVEVASNKAPETGLPGSPLERRSSKPDSSGDPFSRAPKSINLDRSLGSFGYGGGLVAGTPGAPAWPVVGGLPGPGFLISRLTLMLPGGDALTHALHPGVRKAGGRSRYEGRTLFPDHPIRRRARLARRFGFVIKCAVRRWIILLFGVAFFAGEIFAADQLPATDEEESFEIEPPLLIPYERPRQPVAKEGEALVQPSVDVEKLTKDVERAKRSALNAERLFRMGALARVEAEQRALRVVRLQAELENAKLMRIKEDATKSDTVADVKASSSLGDGATLSKANDIDLAKAIEAAHAAAKKRAQAEIEAAEVNLERQQKLLSLGSGRKADVARAAQKLEDLKAARN